MPETPEQMLEKLLEDDGFRETGFTVSDDKTGSNAALLSTEFSKNAKGYGFTIILKRPSEEALKAYRTWCDAFLIPVLKASGKDEVQEILQQAKQLGGDLQSTGPLTFNSGDMSAAMGEPAPGLN